MLEQRRFVVEALVAAPRSVEKLARSRSREYCGPRKLAFCASWPFGVPRLFEQLVPDEQRGAERAAGVAGGGLNPDVLEGPSRSSRPLATQFSATPPAITRFFMPGLPVQLAPHAQHDFLGHRLDAGGQVHVPLLEHDVWLARRPAEQVVELLVRSWSGPGSS